MFVCENCSKSFEFMIKSICRLSKEFLQFNLINLLPFRNCVPRESELINMRCMHQAYTLESSILTEI